MATLLGKGIVVGSGAISTKGDGSQGINIGSLFSGSSQVNWTGTIETLGADSDGIQTQTGGAGTATLTVGGAVKTSGDGSAGIKSTAADGAININVAGKITTTGGASEGILATTTTGDILVISSANIETAGSLSAGIFAQTTTGTASATSNGSIVTKGAASRGVSAVAAAADASVTSNGSITTAGDGSGGILAQAGSGTVSIVSNGIIATAGALSHGIRASAAGGPTGAGKVDSNGTIVTAGAEAHGIYATTTGASTVNVRSSVAALGEHSVGAIVGSALSKADLVIAQGASIMGGWQVGASGIGPSTGFAAAGVVIGGDPAARDPAGLIANQGSIGAWSDRAIATGDLFGISPANGGVQVDNHGTITGFVEFGPGNNIFNNHSPNSFNIRHFADTNGDGDRDTERVAISIFSLFGGGIFDNKSTGTVRLLTVPNATLASPPIDTAGPTAWDLTDAYLPSGVDTSVHDITRPGVEQGQLLNLSRFINAGIITMMDVETGGTGPVAGDLLIISGGPAAGTPGGGIFESAGGQLRLDTVLNEGGAAASRSDILVVDGTMVTRGPTRIFIANAGGAGGQTVGDGIKLVDVLTPSASAPGAFVLGARAGAGAWEYLLFQGGVADPSDGDWYLRNELRVETQVYTTVPIMAHELGFWLLGTYHERMGDPLRQARVASIKDESCSGGFIKDTDAPHGIAIAPCLASAARYTWGRVMAGTGEFSPPNSAESRFDRQGLQAGHDLLQRTTRDGTRESAGFYFTAGQLTADVRSAGAKIGSSDVDAYGVGVYWTRISPSGLYLDAVGQALWSDVEGASTLGARISTDAVALAASLEAGYGLPIGHGVVLEPQAQLIYQALDLDRTADSMGQVSFGTSDQLRGRLGLRLSRVWTGANALQTALWGRVNVWHDFLSGPSTTFASLNGANELGFGIDDRGTYGELQLGVTAQVSRSVALYGQGSWGASLDSESSHDFGGQVGVKVAW